MQVQQVPPKRYNTYRARRRQLPVRGGGNLPPEVCDRIAQIVYARQSTHNCQYTQLSVPTGAQFPIMVMWRLLSLSFLLNRSLIRVRLVLVATRMVTRIAVDSSVIAVIAHPL
jgi:hypothetical protein